MPLQDSHCVSQRPPSLLRACGHRVQVGTGSFPIQEQQLREQELGVLIEPPNERRQFCGSAESFFQQRARPTRALSSIHFAKDSS